MHPQPEPEGCAQLRPLPARVQRQGWQVPGRGAAAAGVPLPLHRPCAVPRGQHPRHGTPHQDKGLKV